MQSEEPFLFVCLKKVDFSGGKEILGSVLTDFFSRFLEGSLIWEFYKHKNTIIVKHASLILFFLVLDNNLIEHFLLYSDQFFKKTKNSASENIVIF